MHFVEVVVADSTYHRKGALTYGSPRELSRGQVVCVPLRSKNAWGVVSRSVSKPSFDAKPIIEAPTAAIIPPQLLDLASWLQDYYPAPSGLTYQLLLPKEQPKIPLDSPVLGPPQTNQLPPLTQDQSAALKHIKSSGLHLLHGDTGSGKTRIYIELALRSFREGRSSIVLTPEIGLTSQLAKNMQAVFGDRVVVLHSGLTSVTRQKTWHAILKQIEPLIIVGARSALFSPLKNVGLIIEDEAHEPAYKQEQAPYYHTTSVAAKLATLHGASLILGSATPLVSDYYIAQAKGRPIIRMTQIAAGQMGQNIRIVDLKDRGGFTKSPHLSDMLLEAIRAALEKKEQVLLFLNRRGTARVIFCDACTWQASCPHCDLPLVYHGDAHIMRCHSCTYRASVPISCPECRNAQVIFKSIGTKAIHDEVKRLFPEARVMRFDTDNKKSERLEEQFGSVHAGEVDIIVGTQTLAKGLDLPKLSLVGVIAADTGLYFPDFSAEERTYQLLSQVLGRVGRGHRSGQVIIQSYEPNSVLLNSITKKDWQKFYNKELKERQKFLFPPFCYLLKVSCKRATAASSQRAAEEFAAQLRSKKYPIIIEGPTPAFHEKVQNKFVWQLIIKAKNRQYLTKIIKEIPSGWSYDIDPMNLL